MWTSILSKYLNFSKKERTGLLILVLLILLVKFLPAILQHFQRPVTYSHQAFEAELAKLREQQVESDSDRRTSYNANRYERYSNEKYAAETPHGERFYFNPNELDEQGWRRLGLKEKTIATIQKYVSKGGRFTSPEDLRKIWGLSPVLQEELIPWVRIGVQQKEQRFADKKFNTESPKPKREKLLVDINTADTTAFIQLPGIGSKLAARIVLFREKLGGFYAIEQVKETFGLPDSTYQLIHGQLTLHSAELRKWNINTATIDQLKTHPYLRFELARAIVQYRLQHGTFQQVEDIQKIMTITPTVFNKIAPYLEVR